MLRKLRYGSPVFSAAPTANYEQVLVELGRHIEGAHRIDRAQIDRSHRLSFSINGTTWCELHASGVRRRYALDDPKIPLAHWALRQPPGNVLVLAYRPGKRLVVKDLARNLVLKGYAAGKSSAPAKYHLIAAAALSCIEGLHAARMMRHNQERSAIELAFSPLSPVRIVQDSESNVDRIGTAIARLQSSVAHPDELEIPLWTTADELQNLLNWQAKIESVGLELPQLWTETFSSLANRVPETQKSVLTHRDLHDGQWLKTRDELCLLDFDSLCRAHPLIDLGNFMAHIDLRYLQSARLGATSRTAKQRGLLRGYCRLATIDFSSLYWFRSASLLRLALVYAIRPRWRYLTGQLSACAASQIQLSQSR